MSYMNFMILNVCTMGRSSIILTILSMSETRIDYHLTTDIQN